MEQTDGYLYGLALVHLNDVEVKTVDSFSRGQKHGFKCEVVSYIHKNLRQRKKQHRCLIASSSSKAFSAFWIKYINITSAGHRGLTIMAAGF